jgi:hypothetical protein
VTAEIGGYTKLRRHVSGDRRIPAMKVPAGPRVTAEHFSFRSFLSDNRQAGQADQTQRTEGFSQHDVSPLRKMMVD